MLHYSKIKNTERDVPMRSCRACFMEQRFDRCNLSGGSEENSETVRAMKKKKKVRPVGVTAEVWII